MQSFKDMAPEGTTACYVILFELRDPECSGAVAGQVTIVAELRH
jgi:hypothetical protein